jgi:hypothetical protein
VSFFAGVKASSFCIHISCPVCIQSAVRGVWSRLFYGHLRCGLPEGSVTSFLPPSIITICHIHTFYLLMMGC